MRKYMCLYYYDYVIVIDIISDYSQIKLDVATIISDTGMVLYPPSPIYIATEIQRWLVYFIMWQAESLFHWLGMEYYILSQLVIHNKHWYNNSIYKPFSVCALCLSLLNQIRLK